MITRPVTAKAVVAAWVVSALLLLDGGCARSNSRTANGIRTASLHIGNAAEPKDLDPNIFEAAIEYTLASALFEGLVNIANDGETILPGVAERWDVSSDGRTYSFHLRPDACWSDGSPLRAEDFVYSFRRTFTPSLGAASSDYGFAIENARAIFRGKLPPESLGIRAVDPLTVELRLEYPAPYVLSVLAGAPFMPVPRAVVERFGGGKRPGTAWTRQGNLIGNGPFVLKTWEPGSNLVVTKNLHYWDQGRITLNEIHFYPIDNDSTEERAFRSHDLHVTFGLPVDKLAAYAAAKPSILHVAASLCTKFIVFNVERPPFTDPRVRRALALCIDRDSLIPSLLFQSGTPAHAMTRDNTGGYSPPPSKDFDPALARTLLSEAGFPGGVGLPMLELLITNRESEMQLAQALQSAWKHELGVAIQIHPEDSKSRISDTNAHHFQFSLGGYFYGIHSPLFILMLARSDSSANYSGWKNSAFDRAFDEANHALDPSQRRSAYNAMERLISDEAPYAPLYFPNKCQLVDPTVHGWRDNPLYVIDWRELSLVTAK